jgi:hypothetical protein
LEETVTNIKPSILETVVSIKNNQARDKHKACL